MTYIPPYEPSLSPLVSSDIMTGCFAVACLAVVIYDWVLTFGREIELVWRRRWSLMTVSYLGVRYFGLLYNVLLMLEIVTTISLTDLGCSIIGIVMNWIPIVVDAMLCVIMISRLYALYEGSRKILISLVIVALFTVTGCIIVAALYNSSLVGQESSIDSIHVCMYTQDRFSLMVNFAWVFTTTWEVLVLCLAIRIAAKHLLRRSSVERTVEGYLKVLVETHLLYFTAFVVASCFNLTAVYQPTWNSTSVGSTVYLGLLYITTSVEMFVLGPRLILTIREYHAKLVADSNTGTEMTSISFQDHGYILTASSV